MEHRPVNIFTHDKGVSVAATRTIAEVISDSNCNGKPTILGFATCHAPANVYRQLIRLHETEGLDASIAIKDTRIDCPLVYRED